MFKRENKGFWPRPERLGANVNSAWCEYIDRLEKLSSLAVQLYEAGATALGRQSHLFALSHQFIEVCFRPTRPANEQTGTRWVSTTASSKEKWDWDWCSRPVSVLPADRVETLLTMFDEACAGGRGRSSSLPKACDPRRANMAGRTPSAARPGTVGGAGPGRAVGLETATTEEAMRETAPVKAPSPAEVDAKEQEAVAPHAAAGEDGDTTATTTGRRRSGIASKKGAPASKGRKAEAVLGDGQRESTQVPKDSVRDPSVSCFLLPCLCRG